MPNFAIMRMQKIKSTTQASARLKHARREIACRTVKDPTATNVRITIGEKMKEYSSKSFREIFREKTAGLNVRKNAVHAVELVLTFSPGAIDPNNREDLKAWAQANMTWVAQTFGGVQNVIDAQLHLDETTPHIHAMVVPIDERGKLNARAFLGGTSHRMSELQTDYAKAMESFGLERGISREITGAKHQAHQRWIAEQAGKEATLHAYEKFFGKELEKDLDLSIDFNKEVCEALNAVSDVPNTPPLDIFLDDLH